jgi:hypothetical protein
MTAQLGSYERQKQESVVPLITLAAPWDTMDLRKLDSPDPILQGHQGMPGWTSRPPSHEPLQTQRTATHTH